MKLDGTDSLKSFEQAKRAVDQAVKEGRLDNSKAREIIDSARNGYREQNYNKMVDKQNKLRGY